MVMVVVVVSAMLEAEMVRAARQLVLSREHSIEHRAALAPQRLLRRSERAISDIDREHSTRQHRSNCLVGPTRALVVVVAAVVACRRRRRGGGARRGCAVMLGVDVDVALGRLVDDRCSHRSHPRASSRCPISIGTWMVHARRRQMVFERS